MRISATAPQDPPLVFPTDRLRSPSTVSFRRSTLVVLVCMALGLLAGTFAAGYYTGLERQGTAAGEGLAAEAEPVLVEGRATYRLPDGRSDGDAGAVVIAIPVDARPDPKIPSFGLRPRDSMPRGDHEDLAHIEAFGGFYVRTDALGECAMVFPSPGKYHLLFISCHALRPSTVGIDELDAEMMETYFLDPSKIIGKCRYRWETRAVAHGSEPIEVDFGRGPIRGRT